MFGLVKTLVAVVVLLGAVVVGLAYLPDETTQKVGAQAAGIFSKGCRGGKMLMDSFKQTLKDKAVESVKGEEAAPAEPAAPAPEK